MIISIIGIILGIILFFGLSIVVPALVLFGFMGLILLVSTYKYISYTRAINIYEKSREKSNNRN
jgi:hypothetical protein